MLAATVIFFTAGPANAQDHGFISGKVINGTASSNAPNEGEIVLVGQRGADPPILRHATIDKDGVFSFSDLPTSADLRYYAQINYKQVTYSSEAIWFRDGITAHTVLTVYESTDENPGIAFKSVSRLLQRQTADAISVLDVIDVSVPGDRTFLPTQTSTAPPPLRFAIPDGSFGLQPIGGFSADDIVIGGPGFAITTPLRPGTATLVYSFQVSLIGGSASFDWPIAYQSDVVRLLSQTSALAARPQGLVRQGSESFGELIVNVWANHDVAAGSRFTIAVTETSLSGIERAVRTTTADRWALVAAASSLVLLLGIAFSSQIQRHRPTPDDLDRAQHLLRYLRKAGNPPEQSALHHELVDLIQQRPSIVAELRRGSSVSQSSPSASLCEPPARCLP